jgi:DNA-binding NarL/FixJ family response regulator
MPAKEALTKRETEILNLITKGFTDREIAEQLSISNKTANTHRKHILQKLNLKNTALLVRYAMENKIIK